MWHKKATTGSGTGTGMGDEVFYGQTFYVDPPGYEGYYGPSGVTHELTDRKSVV